VRIQALVRCLAAEATLSEWQTYRLRLATEELFTNIVRHGYGTRQPAGRVVVEGDLTDAGVWVQLIDTAVLFDPLSAGSSARDPIPPDADPGGLGLRLARWAVDSASHTYVDGTNRTTIMVSRVTPDREREQERWQPECAC
jgi:anti-sigma regulatory factor (Ser/Thr protein kinase)